MKLTVEQIIFAYLSDQPTAVIAETIGVSTHMVRGIKRKRYHRELIEQIVTGSPGKPKSTRHILDDDTVREIYAFDGTIQALRKKFGVSKSVAMNIKFGFTYTSVTANITKPPGELRVYNLSWDDVCTIRCSKLTTSVLAEMFGVSQSTIRNIRSGRTRVLK